MSILEIIGGLSIILFVGKLLYILYERLVVKPKDPTSYGKWVIITGSTSGIGKEYAEYLGKRKMNILLISRSKDKLIEQQQELKEAFNVEVKYIAYDFTVMGEARDEFYKQLNIECEYMHENGGIGLLINNVGIANQYPQRDDELTDIEESNMINCNIDSTVFMSRTVLKYMSKVNKGAILNLSSGSGNIPSPYIAMYSSTK